MPRKLYNPDDRARVVSDEGRSSQLPREEYRSDWRRDYARVIHSAAFRRLQGKTQLFPNHESDFFRNRLTHSLEVAQVAKSIATRLNATESLFHSQKVQKIDPDLVETAALCHDLGHPPFGHNGEEALDECMSDAGGFEGNAQTLRILAKLEKRQTKSRDGSMPVAIDLEGNDNRAGLNLTYRTLASILKYDNEIPEQRRDRKGPGVQKGYYVTERDLVTEIKKRVAGNAKATEFKVLECTIMDLADDIAYSTYDLEDAFKANFLSPLTMISAPDTLLEKVAERVAKGLKKHPLKLTPARTRFAPEEVVGILLDLFGQIFDLPESVSKTTDDRAARIGAAKQAFLSSKTLCEDGYFRTELTSQLVGRFIRGVKLKANRQNPALSIAYLELDTFKEVEVLKHFTFQSLIMSPMLKVSEYRGKDIVKQIFDAIEKNGELLMPDDFRKIYRNLDRASDRKRVICDFIAGMTDKYAIEFHRRLYSTTSETIFRPL